MWVIYHDIPVLVPFPIKNLWYFPIANGTFTDFSGLMGIYWEYNEICFIANLVGGFNPSEKYEFVSWEYYSQNMED